MITKHHIVTHKPWSQTGSIGFSAAGLIAKLRNIVNIEIPVGYQDESGFHYGSKSAVKDVKYPSFW